jgi:microcystin-dependent protein
MLWSGAANAIPNGYVLCDGNNSTPDLRDRFVVGAGNNYAVDATGGADSVTLTLNQIPSHTHGYDRATQRNVADGGVNGAYVSSLTSATSGSAGGGQAHENRPPYYALCYIMKT